MCSRRSRRLASRTPSRSLKVPAFRRNEGSNFWVTSRATSTSASVSFPATRHAAIDTRRRQYGSSLTHRWREMDSNFQYAGAVNLVVGPFGWVVLWDRVRSGRGASGTAVSATGLGDLSRRLGAAHRPSDLWCARLGSNRAHGSIHDAADRERRYHTCRRRNRRRNPARRRKIFDRTSGATTPSRPRPTWYIRRRL